MATDFATIDEVKADAGAEGELDLSHFWMPFTNNRYFKANPRLFVAAKDMHFTRDDGGQVLDATSGLWCVNGRAWPRGDHRGDPRSGRRARFCTDLPAGHPSPFRLASAVAKIMPPGLDRIFFTNSGSESADTALKMALAYHQAKGDSGRFRLIGRSAGYHGTNFGGLSVGGIGGQPQALCQPGLGRRSSGAYPRRCPHASSAGCSRATAGWRTSSKNWFRSTGPRRSRQ